MTFTLVRLAMVGASIFSSLQVCERGRADSISGNRLMLLELGGLSKVHRHQFHEGENVIFNDVFRAIVLKFLEHFHL